MDLFNQKITPTPAKLAKPSKYITQFNGLLKKIEKAQAGILEKEKNLDDILRYYRVELLPELKELTNARIDFVPALYEVFRHGNLKPADASILELILNETISEVGFHSDMPDALKKIYSEINQSDFEVDFEESFNEQVADLEMYFHSQGLKIDLSDLNSKMNEAEFMSAVGKKLASALPDIEEKVKAKKPRKKSSKAQEKEENQLKMVELRNRSITSIYRELAKMLHPDLEMDASVKLEKEELMKKLTIAYENQDLFTLIKLELQWLNRAERPMEKMGDDIMKAFNEQLKAQLTQLELELEQMDFAPRYFELTKLNEGLPILIVPWKEMKTSFIHLTQSIRTDISDITSSKSPVPKSIRELIKIRKQEIQEEQGMMDEFDDFLKGFF